MYKVMLTYFDRTEDQVQIFTLDHEFYYKTYAEVVADGIKRSIVRDGMQNGMDCFVVEE